MERSIMLNADDAKRDVDVTFYNVNGEKALIPLLLNLIVDAAEYVGKPTGEFTRVLIKAINSQLPVYGEPDTAEVSEDKPNTEKTDGGFIKISFDKKPEKAGVEVGFDIEEYNVNADAELNVLNMFVSHLINTRKLPVPMVLLAVSKAIDKDAKIEKLNLDDTDCDNDTCADCECRCDKSTEVKASADTNGDTEAKGNTVAPPDYKGEMRTPTNLRSTGDTDIPDKYRETSFG